MILLKSTLLSLTTLLVSAASPMAAPPVEVNDIEYCYSVTLSLNLPGGGGISTDLEVSACGNTPGEGLFNLGVAVRHAYANQEQ